MARNAVAGIAFLAALLLGACARDVPRATRDGPIVAFGDSLVHGTGSSGGGFVRLLEERSGRPIENLGMPGNTTADGLARIDEVLELKPAVVILLLGGNDFLRQVPQDTTGHGTAYVHDVLDDTLGVEGYMADQVHPNDAGYRVIADRVYPVLVSMLK